MPYIYKIENDINNKVYVGKTLRTPERRFKEHCNDAFTRKCEKRPLYSAMRKYGIEHFHISILEECSEEEINDKEQYWIQQLNSYHNGYNATYGGDGKPYINKEAILKEWKENPNFNMKDVAEKLQCCVDTVKITLTNYGVTQEDIDLRVIKKNQEPVARLDKKTKEVLEYFPSIEDAEKIFQTGRHISQVCKGSRQSAKGYGWRYLTAEEKINLGYI